MDNSITILYLDDEEVNLFIFNANFKNKFNVITSSSPKEALEQLDNHKSDLIAVISDMRMPIMSGIEFVELAKKKNDKIFYYILTGFDYNKEIEDALNNGLIDKFFSKPFDAKEIETELMNAAKKLEKY